MIIEISDTTRTVHDYDFTFVSGHFLQVTVDSRYGDTISFGDRIISIQLGEKTVNGRVLPAEDLSIFVGQLASFAHRQRKVQDRTVEEEEAWAKTLQELTGTIQ